MHNKIIHVNTIDEYFLFKTEKKKQFDISGVSDFTNYLVTNPINVQGGFSKSLTSLKQWSLKRSQVIPVRFC